MVNFWRFGQRGATEFESVVVIGGQKRAPVINAFRELLGRSTPSRQMFASQPTPQAMSYGVGRHRTSPWIDKTNQRKIGTLPGDPTLPLKLKNAREGAEPESSL